MSGSGSPIRGKEPARAEPRCMGRFRVRTKGRRRTAGSATRSILKRYHSTMKTFARGDFRGSARICATATIDLRLMTGWCGKWTTDCNSRVQRLDARPAEECFQLVDLFAQVS